MAYTNPQVGDRVRVNGIPGDVFQVTEDGYRVWPLDGGAAELYIRPDHWTTLHVVPAVVELVMDADHNPTSTVPEVQRNVGTSRS